MKSTILNIKKRVLVVETESGNYAHDVITKDDGSLERVKLICKGSELSEEIANTLAVEFKFGKYKLHNKPWYLHTDSALDSFISAIEADGYYWSKNPLGDEPRSYSEVVDGVSADELMDDLREWNEAESKTFHPEQVILFEIL